MKLFSENIKQFIGQTVIVYIGHKIYGEQELKIRKLQPLCDKNRIGLIVGTQPIFLEHNEIENILFTEDELCIQSELLTITIKKV